MGNGELLLLAEQAIPPKCVFSFVPKLILLNVLYFLVSPCKSFGFSDLHIDPRIPAVRPHTCNHRLTQAGKDL